MLLKMGILCTWDGMVVVVDGGAEGEVCEGRWGDEDEESGLDLNLRVSQVRY